MPWGQKLPKNQKVREAKDMFLMNQCYENTEAVSKQNRPHKIYSFELNII